MNRDGTGPEGKGPKTGRGLGNCSSIKPTNTKNRPRFGLGFGRGRSLGFGRGLRRRFRIFNRKG